MLYLREINHTDMHTEAAHYVILKGDKSYRYLREINHTVTHTEAAHYVILKGVKSYRYAYLSYAYTL